MLHSNTENGYDAYIVQYDFTASEYANLDEGSINSRNTILLPIDFDTSLFNNGELSKMVYGCVETWEWSDGVPNNGQVHGADCTCNPSQGWVLTSISCGNYDDGASGGGNGIPTGPGTSDGGSGGDSSGTTYDNGFDPTDPNNHGNSGNLPILTAPAIEVELPDHNPEKLNILTQHPQVKAKIIELKGKTSENREYGYQFNVSGNNPITYNLIEGELAPDNQGIKFPPASVFTQLEMHTHFDGLDNVFSASDLYRMTKLSADSNNPDATAILVAPNGKLYALMVTDQVKVNAFKALHEQEGEVEMEKKYYRNLIYYAKKKCDGTCTIPEFHDLINSYLVYYLYYINSGLTLYEATEDSNGNITWHAVVYTP